jgi:hypothetical protein
MSLVSFRQAITIALASPSFPLSSRGSLDRQLDYAHVMHELTKPVGEARGWRPLGRYRLLGGLHHGHPPLVCKCYLGGYLRREGGWLLGLQAIEYTWKKPESEYFSAISSAPRLCS